MLKNILIWGLAGFGAYTLYEKSPISVKYGQGARLGGVQEAIMWEQAGGPPHGDFRSGGLANRRRGRKSRR